MAKNHIEDADELIRRTYRELGTVKGTARKLGLTIYAVEKACNVGDYHKRLINPDIRKKKTSFGKAKKISEDAMLDKESEEEHGRKVLKMFFARLREKEYVLDSELRKECKVSSDHIWDKLRAEYPKSVILVGHGPNPKPYWGDAKSCSALVRGGKAIFLDDIVS